MVNRPNPFASPERLRRLQVEITTHCTLSCAGCQRTIGRQRGTWTDSHMSADTLRTLLGHLPPADLLVLQGVGEPTLHPDLAGLIRLGRESGRFGVLSLNTNALAVPLEAYRAIRAAGLDHLSLSVDSLDDATARAVRAGSSVSELSRRIPSLVALFEGRITASIVLSRRNQAELGGLIEALVRLGVTTIEVQPLVAYDPATEPQVLGIAELRHAAATVTGLRGRLPGIALLLAAGMTPNGTRCRRPFHSAYVTVDGLMTPCCITDDADLLGRTSLIEQSYAEAWHAPPVAAWFADYFDREPPLCRGCGFNPRGKPDERLPELTEGRRLRRSGRHDEAIRLLRRAARRLPLADLLGELALASAGRGDPGAAGLLDVAMQLHEAPAPAHDLAGQLLPLGQFEPAVRLAMANLARHPGFETGWRDVVALLRQKGRAGGAALVALARQALQSHSMVGLVAAIEALVDCGEPDDALLTLANLLRVAGRADLARTLLEGLAARVPGDVGLLMALCVAQLEIVYQSEAEIETRRHAFLDRLAQVEAALETTDAAGRARAAGQIGQAKPFFLAYQGRDDVEPMRRWGRIVATLAASTEPPPLLPRPRRERIRVGFACAYFRPHSVSKLFGGWLGGLDRARFEIVGYDLSGRSDPPPLAAACDRFEVGPHSDPDWMRVIREDRLDVLIYPELGMDPVAVRLAARRLAPVQCVAWGHPVTSGLPEIDYFLSSALMEPDQADAHYSERLVRLPNLSVCYRPLPPEPPRRPLTRRDLGLSDQDVVYICCQSLFKYLPGFDDVFVRIAAQVERACFVFIEGMDATTTARFRQRLEAAFPGDAAARPYRLVPRIDHADFPAFLALGDVYLDSIGWSGGNTTLEAVAAGLPIVTHPTEMMRGRHSAAILTQAGLGDRVAADVDAYVALAVALGQSAEARGQFRQRLAEGRDRLYDDPAPVRALERFLISALVP
ncbi:radical SAM protein [Magnetospirillum fulvum]|uniref:Putative O-linked N-acetylglucosamine transferase, SPINDLY family protein n=1 Tax=Magnetospirillum fulvum MGU-K5 TaxID=1316936 RepID=S9S8Z2_MAGFU|nr:radical SAM protein [Magnetospirillum fulvum]EPY01139.1 putative O-linked N-acetylglucosamine transferase, SPINDLY family protein [Magnetospirillum fulvum MGU-K5]